MNSGTRTWYSSGPTCRRSSSSRTRFTRPVIFVIMLEFVAAFARMRGLPRASPAFWRMRLLSAVVMAKRHRQRVGDVRRLRHGRQPQFTLDRSLHLLLGRPAVAGDDLLHLGRGVTDDRDALLRRRQEDDAARVPHED